MPTLEITQDLLDQLNSGESITIEPPKKKIELEVLEYRFTDSNINRTFVFVKSSGRSRNTEEACELAQKRMNKMNRLSQLAHQLGGEMEYDPNTTNWYVFSSTNLIWGFASSRSYYPEKVYMTEECAEQICQLLNSGEFEL